MKEYYLPYHYYGLEEWQKQFDIELRKDWDFTDEEWDDYWRFIGDRPDTLVIDDSYFEDDETYYDILD